jgi:hypothetical protein
MKEHRLRVARRTSIDDAMHDKFDDIIRVDARSLSLQDVR